MRKMKKLLSLILTLVLVMGLSVNVLAEGALAATIQYSTSKAAPTVGEEFTVTAEITEQTGFNALDIQLVYDDQVVQFLGFETEYDEYQGEDILVTDLTGFTISYNETKPKVSMARAKDFVKTGEIFTARFKALALGNTGITLNEDTFSMASGNGDKLTVTQDFSGIENLAVVEVVDDPVADEGYTVSLTPDTQEKVVGDTAEVKVNIASKENNAFNAVHAELTYDPSCLSLTTSSIDGYTLTDDNGKIVISGYGEAKELGDAVTLQFQVKARPENGTDVELTAAYVDISDNADEQDAPEASYGNKVSTITASGISISIPENYVTGDYTVEAGQDYTFKAINPYYDYEFEATMGASAVEVKDNGDGTFTIAGVTDDLVITLVSRTAKSFSVTVNGAETDQVTAKSTATYGTEYSFTVASVTGKNTEVAVEVGGEKYTGYSVLNGVYRIPGTDITGDIAITVTNTVTDYKATFEGNAAGDAKANSMAVTHGRNFDFAVTKASGYTYTITATMGGSTVEVKDNGDGTYTIANVTGDLVITVEKTEAAGKEVEVSVDVKLDGAIVYMVTVSDDTLPEGSALAFEGNVMYWSDEYQAYTYLVTSGNVMSPEEVNEKITIVTGVTVPKIDHTGNVNGAGSIDINDAQLVYDIYNVKYKDISELSMLKVLNADVNSDKKIDVYDAAAVVNTIHAN